jgi:hypothetical protein
MWECKPLWLRRWSRPERADIRSALTVLAAVVPGRHALLIGRTLIGISNPRIADRRHGLCQQGDAPEIDRAPWACISAAAGWAPWADG